MKRMVFAFGVLTLINLGSAALLPERVASHFGVGGEPNDWMSRGSLVATMQAVYLVLLVAFLGSTALVRRMPPRWVNLPHRAYWLAPERREATLARVGTLLGRLGAVMFTFLAALHILVIQANRSQPVRLDEPTVWTLLAVLGLYMGMWVYTFYRAFRLPRAGEGDAPRSRRETG